MAETAIGSARESAILHRRHMQRLAALTLVSLLLICLVGTVSYYVFESNRQGARALSDNLLDALARRVEAQLVGYLAPTENLAMSLQYLVGDRPILDRENVISHAALGTMRTMPHVTGLLVADTQGNFVFPMRNAFGSFDTKIVDFRSGVPLTRWIRRDAKGALLRVEDDPNDKFDARTRSWYQGARESGKPFWTDAYVFFTSREPGISYAVPNAASSNTATLVTGVDIELDNVSRFLASLEIGKTGRAFIIDSKGRVIAAPIANWQPPVRDGVAVLPRLDEMGDPILTRAFSHLQVEGPGKQLLTIDRTRIIITSEPLHQLSGRDWLLLVAVPENDFLEFVNASGRIAGLLLIVALALALAMTGFLAWQGARADNRASLALQRQRWMEAQAQAFARLAQLPNLHDPGTTEGLAAATETAAHACGVRRVSVWRLAENLRSLTCEDCFDAAAGGHTSGTTLHREELPRFFAALAASSALAGERPDDARALQELQQAYLEPLGIRTVQAFTIRDDERTRGVVLFEGTVGETPIGGTPEFGAALASLLTLRFIGHTAAATALPQGSEVTAAPVEADVVARDGLTPSMVSLQQLLLSNLPTRDRVRMSAHTAVLALTLPDWQVLAGAGQERKTKALDAIARLVQAKARDSGLSYAALLDDRILLAGLADDEAVARRALTALALTGLFLRDGLANLAEELDLELGFAFGLDIGLAVLAEVGEDPAILNLSGSAVRSAFTLAASAQPGAIMVSEPAYEQIRGNFLFRPAGRYLLPDSGVIGTYALVSGL